MTRTGRARTRLRRQGQGLVEQGQDLADNEGLVEQGQDLTDNDKDW